MNGYSGHTHKWHKPDGTFNYVQVHLKTDQGSKTFTNAEAVQKAAENPGESLSCDDAARVAVPCLLSADWNTQDLFHSIQKGDYPSWSVFVQVLSPEEAEKFRFNVFDLTKVWPQGEVPLRRIGTFRLNRNVEVSSNPELTI